MAIMAPPSPLPISPPPPNTPYTPQLEKQTDQEGPPPEEPKATHPPVLPREIAELGRLQDHTTATWRQKISRLREAMKEAKAQV